MVKGKLIYIIHLLILLKLKNKRIILDIEFYKHKKVITSLQNVMDILQFNCNISITFCKEVII